MFVELFGKYDIRVEESERGIAERYYQCFTTTITRYFLSRTIAKESGLILLRDYVLPIQRELQEKSKRERATKKRKRGG